jgi:hypothetical protein
LRICLFGKIKKLAGLHICGGAFRYVVTDDHSNALPDLGPNPGYADAKTAWAAYEERRGIAREIDLNEM